MAPHKYEIGQKFGQLTLIERLRGDVWRCRCTCGNIIEPFAGPVQRGSKTSCGCKPKGRGRPASISNKPGEVFGALKLIEYIGGSRWLCKCECGKLKEVLTIKLNNGAATSCGCGIHRNRNRPLKTKLPPPPIVAGKVFGKLRTVAQNGGGWWTCVCKCGTTLSVKARALRSGEAKSCGVHNCTNKSNPRNKVLDPMDFFFKRS